MRRRGYGDLTHINNHAAALTELAQFGYPQLAKKGLAAHHRHVRLWRDLPNVVEEIGRHTPAKNDPHTRAYWTSGKVNRGGAALTHRIKTLYGFDELLEWVEDKTKREIARKQLQKMMIFR